MNPTNDMHFMNSRAAFPLGPFTPYENNPILSPLGKGWESANLYNPAAIVVDDEVVLLYRAHSTDIVSHIGLAHSSDGLHFDREKNPILSPSEAYDRYGCEDPRITKIDGTYYLTYTGWDRHSALLCLATSTDLHNWTKHGPIFSDFDTFAATKDARGFDWSKAGVIVPFRIQNKWWMYFGEGCIYAATSSDLIHWQPLSDDKHPIYSPTSGSFDADLVEIGAPPIMADNGLLIFLVNGAVRTLRSDGTYDVDYRCGQFAIDPDRPGQVIARMQIPWLAPQSFEDLNGMIPNVTFVEGLVQFHGVWLAYYGQSDTTLAVATYDPRVNRWGSHSSRF